MNCSGRIILSTESNIRLDYSQDKSYVEEYDLEDLTDDDLESENDVKSSSTNHFLVLNVDPIPHPSCTKTPLAGYSFLTKHTLDMKYTSVDEKYDIKQLIFLLSIGKRDFCFLFKGSTHFWDTRRRI
jgi:hypoxia-inducible factor 1 alpha